MPRVFIAALVADQCEIVIDGADGDHLARSLRMRPGQHIVAVADDGVEHGVVIDQVKGGTVRGHVEWNRSATGEPRLRLHVLQALIKDGMDEAIDALAEIGVAAIHPVITERTVPRPDQAAAARRVQRWQAIAREAAMVSGRGRIPSVSPIRRLDEALVHLPTRAKIYACVAGGTSPSAALADVSLGSDDGTVRGTVEVALCIGPEGGLSGSDMADLDRHHAIAVHLGSRVLRSRFAGLVAATLTLRASGDLARPVTV